MSASRPRLTALILFLIALLSGLGAGAMAQRRAFLSRGIPERLPGPIVGGGVRLGINVDLHDLPRATWADHLERMRAAGITHLKQPFAFTPSFDWEAASALTGAVTGAGLELVPLLDGDPALGYAPPAKPADFAAWAGAFAARFGPSIRHYIVWDEPNLASHWGGGPVNAAAYAAILAAAAEAIRAADADALIVAAPLAPTVETGPANLSDVRYLQLLYEEGVAGAFDIVAAKPYGFDDGPEERRIAADHFNFSRAILLRERMVAEGDAGKALWAGNWGWNSLPADWSGRPSIWGGAAIDAATQAAWIRAGLARAEREWPWMGVMFLENWAIAAPADDPRAGFSIAGRAAESALQAAPPLAASGVAMPGFHLADAADPAQQFHGDWRFSPAFGADAPNTGDVADPAANAATFRFNGTDIGLRVRRADYRARFIITVDGRPANALPRDERGRSMLVLTAADPAEDYMAVEPVARDLPPGEHLLRLEPYRGWDQWALSGFSVMDRPPVRGLRLGEGALAALAFMGVIGGAVAARRADWGEPGARLAAAWRRLADRSQLALAGLLALLITLTGWLTWGEQSAGIYRRLGDMPGLALTAAAASTFYVAPSFFVYLAALGALFVLIYWRPAWGLALIAATLPWSVRPKPMLGYRFSPIEVFILVTLAAAGVAVWSAYVARRAGDHAARPAWRRPRLAAADWAVLALLAVATLSLPFTARQDVALNEWRTVLLEPTLLYFMLRVVRLEPREWRIILAAFLVGGGVVAAIGLGQFALGQNLITAEAGLPRLRSIYGSPNNVALYLGRVWPILAALVLFGGRRRRLGYALLLLVVAAAWLLTFSKGALFLGLPAASLVLLVAWRQARGGRAWPWVAGALALGLLALALAWQVPALAARLDPRGETGFLRLNLWRASLNMALDQPWTGVGLDNFLYAYRGAYLFDAAWREPNLSHPHNLFLDFATRLGVPGLVAGLALCGAFARELGRWRRETWPRWEPAQIGIAAALAGLLAHGLVDHTFFLVDLAGSFLLLFGLAMARPTAPP